MTRDYAAIAAYVRQVRSPSKREYAKQYADYLEQGQPEGGEPERGAGLSYMAAQAVRMHLRAHFLAEG